MGCPAGPNDTIFNTRVDALPLDPNSSAWMAWANAGPLSIESDNWGISYADGATPTRSLKTYYGSVSYPNFVMPTPGPGLKRQGGNNTGTFGWISSPDHHVVTVRHTDCSIYESYDDYLGGFTRPCQDGSAGCNVEGAIVYKSTDYAVINGGVTNAAGLPLAPTVWRLDEINSGHITHAGYFTTNLGGVLFNAIRWPAVATAGGCEPGTCPSAMPMGARVRLSAAFNNALVCNTGVSQLDQACNTILTGMKEYGFILSDTGETNALQTLSDVSQETYVMAAIKAIVSSRISMTNFEVVDESSLEVNANSFQVCPYNQTCMNGINSYVNPQDQSVIVATAADGSVLNTAVAVQGIAIGLGIPSVIPVVAGTYSFQISFWVNGTLNQTVNWNLQSGVGAVSSSGVYTPPSTLTGGLPATAVLLGTSAANPNAVVQLSVNVLPASATDGALRIDTGSQNATTDASLKTWLADIGIDGATTSFPSDWPNWTKAIPRKRSYINRPRFPMETISDIRLSSPTDLTRSIFLFGQNSDSFCNITCTSWLTIPNTPWDEYNFGPYALETQGQIQAHNFSYGALANYMFQVPVDAFIPAVASNNLLQIYVRGMSNDVAPYLTPQLSDQEKFTVLNGVEIIPDSTTPYWAIDTQNQTSINAGQSLARFYVVDWYTGRNDPIWSIVTGPAGASIDATGVLSLNANAQTNGEPIIVMATDGAYSATTQISTPSSAAPPPTVTTLTASVSAMQFGAGDCIAE